MCCSPPASRTYSVVNKHPQSTNVTPVHYRYYLKDGTQTTKITNVVAIRPKGYIKASSPPASDEFHASRLSKLEETLKERLEKENEGDSEGEGEGGSRVPGPSTFKLSEKYSKIRAPQPQKHKKKHELLIGQHFPFVVFVQQTFQLQPLGVRGFRT